MIFQPREALFMIIQAFLGVWRRAPALHRRAQKLLHQVAEGDPFLRRSCFEGIHQGGIQGHIQLSSLGGGHRCLAWSKQSRTSLKRCCRFEGRGSVCDGESF